MTRYAIVAALGISSWGLAGCEGDATTQYGEGVTSGEPFLSESKPVGDPSREPYGPEHVGGLIQVPAGERGPASNSNSQAPARNRINP